MSTLWDKLRAGLQTVSDKTEEMTQIGRLKIEIIAVKRDIEKSFVELGGRVYHLLEEDKAKNIERDEEIRNLADRIKDHEQKLKRLQEKIENIQSSRTDTDPAAE